MGETIVETVAETIEAATESVSYVTEIMITTEQYTTLVEYLNLLTGFGLFFVVVALCYFGYKFFRIFF